MIEYIKTYVRLKHDDRAVTALEYALIAGLIAIAIIGAATSLGGNIASVFNKVGSDVNT